ncbi:hypothetical protein HN832_05135 [archaeon]|jgi:ribosomal protein S3AE|nr:hypothetical protein [archaeon]MBT4373750.1 hypothetical protein [archaeon]MBT4532216.1 hypothetical protein [archaeon]MBT7001440.1 hypothetical protein [archaeon]MBT7282768.1 hypothetical protein [archaeon]
MAQAKRKKKFFKVEIPIISKETDLQAFEIEELKGKHIKYDLTRLQRGKSIILQAKIEVQDNTATAVPKKLTILPYFMKRLVRKGTNYVEDSFSTESKDFQIKIKPFLVTRRKVSRAVRKALRNKAKEELINEIKTKTANEVFEEILKNNLQKKLSLVLKKIYPLSSCEIRRIKVEKELENAPTKEIEPTKVKEKKPVKKEVTKTQKEKPAQEIKEEAGRQ